MAFRRRRYSRIARQDGTSSTADGQGSPSTGVPPPTDGAVSTSEQSATETPQDGQSPTSEATSTDTPSSSTPAPTGTTTIVSTTENQAEASSVVTTSTSPTITDDPAPESSPTGEQSSTSEEASSTGDAESVTSSDSSPLPPPPPTSSSTSSSTTSETTSDLPTSTSSSVSTTESTSTSTSSSSSDSATETSTTSTELPTSTTSTSASETTSNTETTSFPTPTSSEPTSAPVSLLPTSFTTIEFTTSINGQLTTVTTETPLPTSLWSATPSPNRAMPALIAGVSVGAAVIVLIIIGGIFAYRRHQQKRAVFGFVERLVANQKHQQGRARLLEGEEFNEDDEDLNMTPYRDRDGVHSRGSSLAGMTPMPVHSRGMSSTNAFGVLDPNGRGTPNSSVSAVAGASGTGNSSPSPSLFRARGNESGSIFHEGGIWPPPGEESRLVDPFAKGMGAGEALLGNSATEYAGVPTSSPPFASRVDKHLGFINTIAATNCISSFPSLNLQHTTHIPH
ncbi:hypothetical protein ONZ45_g13372 [Pleurotus djamor]|nr:hypothetical protein ONZ45_g13372 [Pleurotus djamor]